jgi:hypothetical protein
MPTIPPFIEPTHPDAWHQVLAPGGYEWWHFEADDVQNDRHVIVRFSYGCIDYPDYVRAYSLYRKFPTRFAPPRPGDFVALQLLISELGRVKFRASIRYPSDSFSAATDSPSVNIGPNRIDPLADQNLRVTLSLDSAGAELIFRPRFTHAVQSLLLGEGHHWLTAGCVYDVEGTLDLVGSTILMSGRGYHDHHFGTAAPSNLTKHWLAGHVLDDDSTRAFVITNGGARLIEASAESIQAITPEIQYSGEPHMTGQLIRYPSDIDIGQVVRLGNPRVVDATLSRACLVYDANVHKDAPLKAWCEMVHPRRAGWPGAGRLGGKWIEKT